MTTVRTDWTPVPLHTSQQVREAEKPLLEAGEAERLMRLAAGGLATAILRTLSRPDDPNGFGQREEGRGDRGRAGSSPNRSGTGAVFGRRVAVLAGPGSNAGDALYAAASLAGRGCPVDVLTPMGGTHKAGLAAAMRAGAKTVGPADWHAVLGRADLVIDGLLGTGARPQLDMSLTPLITAVNAVPLRFAADVPTGLDATTGQVSDTAVCATHTVTFGAAKLGLFLPQGAGLAGRVTITDIGLDTGMFGAGPAGFAYPPLRAPDQVLPPPPAEAHKYARGVVGIAAGSEAYPGAGVLTASAAAATGAGMVRLTGHRRVTDRITLSVPEAVAGPGRVDAWVVGPGTPEEDTVLESFEHAGHRQAPLIVDAGALSAFARVRQTGSCLPPAVLTPHAGEAQSLARDLGLDLDPVGDAAGAAAALAQTLGAVVLLKGPRTVICEPDGTFHLPAQGPSDLATAGSGDVLAGIMGALAAVRRPRNHRELATAAAAAVSLHNLAGRGARQAGDIVEGLRQPAAAQKGSPR